MGRPQAKVIIKENRGGVCWSSDPQMEIADRITGHNVTYPIVGEQSAKRVDMQSAIAVSIVGKY
ncbi:hypothetical protein [Novosphingobium sediminicola]|uniref:Uncharacterized protein n=1 Tax=Novosphingobium sediminicola TaxID=563162 RepID=A0A7W6CJU0_9SPHN|nr:hypothetical protein [Novosphingobium sediminicola]MBB3957856.1 hypothetical protein [Novosphingobium sediminicola]